MTSQTVRGDNAVGISLTCGTGLGPTVVVLLVGGPGIAIGAVVGAGLGVLAGAVAQSQLAGATRPRRA